MYRKIWVHDKHKRFQRLSWRENSNQPIKTYNLNTAIYGTTAAPISSTWCLKQIAVETKHTHPHISNVIETNFHVDDLLTGVSTLSAGQHLQRQL